MWIEALAEADVLADGVRTIAYTYIGPEITHPVYRDGTIGQAKSHLEQTAKALDEFLQAKSGSAHISVNKAMVTQSSAAIPVVPLYISLLYKVMKEKGCHESCIEQMHRLFAAASMQTPPPTPRGASASTTAKCAKTCSGKSLRCGSKSILTTSNRCPTSRAIARNFWGFSALALRALTTRQRSMPSGGCHEDPPNRITCSIATLVTTATSRLIELTLLA